MQIIIARTGSIRLWTHIAGRRGNHNVLAIAMSVVADISSRDDVVAWTGSFEAG
jgi:hypothetical protein